MPFTYAIIYLYKCGFRGFNFVSKSEFDINRTSVYMAYNKLKFEKFRNNANNL